MGSNDLVKELLIICFSWSISSSLTVCEKILIFTGGLPISETTWDRCVDNLFFAICDPSEYVCGRIIIKVVSPYLKIASSRRLFLAIACDNFFRIPSGSWPLAAAYRRPCISTISIEKMLP